MLQTIEAQIDTNGYIRPLESLVNLPVGRVLLIALEEQNISLVENKNIQTKPSVFQDLFGILTTQQSATLERMEQTILQCAGKNFNDCD